MTLDEALKAGAEFHYAPISGGLILMLKGERLTDVPYTMLEFLNLREKTAIVHAGYMGQGHHILHGRVDFYKLKDLTPPVA